MTKKQIAPAIVGEILEVLDGVEKLIGRVAPGREGSRAIDAIMGVRSQLLQQNAQEGVCSANLLRAILENAVDAIIVTDERGSIEIFNPAAERVFGFASGEVIGRLVTLLMPPEFVKEHGEAMMT